VSRKPRPTVALARADGAVVCERCTVAATALTRLQGLLGRRRLDPGEGLLLRPASSIHTFFMRFPIDVVFLDRELAVRKVVPELGPWRFAGARGAKSALELRAGEAERRAIATGQRLVMREPD
jgi:uncharacterized membrane protein (UPF0127 family)